ncbi:MULTISPECIES: arginase [Sellimonas]|uniref:Arginase n=1 Tax=Sellimonas caecigallum TaxID=2592333 RepID=A0ABS7L4F9_9FIRM|nr:MULTISPECIES: arginase [Sellimonas]MBY0757919.1 arginase [Sellimonas caecigallum]OUP64405.1 arginase [Drancourtella sp. An177]
MFSIFGCPMHHGVGAPGLKYSLDYLRNRYENLRIAKLPEIIMEEDASTPLKNLNTVAATCQSIAQYMYSVLEIGKTPIFLGGDHSVVMGSASASSVYVKDTFGEDTGLIYIDAHADINTDQTTVTGNIHGVPVSALLGMGNPKLTGFLKEGPKYKPENIVYLGLRDIDPPELTILNEQKILYYTYEEICDKGLDQCLTETIRHLSHLNHIHLSFDIDSMDPDIMPGVSVPVPGGFDEEDVFLMFRRLMNELHILSYDIVEFNQEYDKGNRTADFVSELVDFIEKSGKN